MRNPSGIQDHWPWHEYPADYRVLGWRVDLRPEGSAARLVVHDAVVCSTFLAILCDLTCDPPLPLDVRDRAPAPRAPAEPRFWVELPGVGEFESLGEWDGIDEERWLRAQAAPVHITDTFDWDAGEGGAVVIKPPPQQGRVVLSASWFDQGMAKASVSFDL